MITIKHRHPEDFKQAVETVLGRIQTELERQLELQAAGRFERACSHPENSDDDNFKISVEEMLEVTIEMQAKPRNEEHLEEEVKQACATLAGWLIARERRRIAA